MSVMYYSWVVIILFNTHLYKSAFPSSSFENLVFRLPFFLYSFSVLNLMLFLKSYKFFLINVYVTKCCVIFFSLYINSKNYLENPKKFVLEKTLFQNGFEFFKSISIIKKQVEHQIFKAVQNMWQVSCTRSSFCNFILELFFGISIILY